MYLTRMQLDTTRRNTMKALTAPNLIHGAVESAFPGERKRNLWRIDYLNGKCYLLVLSQEIPDLSAVLQQFGAETASPAWETKEYGPFLERIQAGSVWRFRLVANPTKSCARGDESEKRRGVVHAQITPRYQEDWLQSRADKHGFTLEQDSFMVTHSKWYVFNKDGNQKNKVTLLAVAYEGILTVTVPELFRQTLVSGIGRGKAYGLGLMTIVRP